MKQGKKIKSSLFLIVMVALSFNSFSGAIDTYYNLHKNDRGMESKKIPPKMAAMMVDDDYPDAIDVLKSLRSLKYLNFYGDKDAIEAYASSAIKSKGNFVMLLDEQDKSRKVRVFGVKKKGKVKKIMAVVETGVQFILLIGKGSLTNSQIAKLPALSKEIQ